MLLQTPISTDCWINATWDEFIQVSENPAWEKSKSYYYNKELRIETMGVGPDHASDNTMIAFIVTLYCTLKGIPAKGLTNASYRKTGMSEGQPDLSYYFGDRAQAAPQGRSIANLDTDPPPDLVIEIADTSLGDDIGKKRLLYEDMAVSEYWVVDVVNVQVLAFEILQQGSQRITSSKVLPGLAIATLVEALEQSRTLDQSQVGAWLLEQF